MDYEKEAKHIFEMLRSAAEANGVGSAFDIETYRERAVALLAERVEFIYKFGGLEKANEIHESD